jgi:hypothetical protein
MFTQGFGEVLTDAMTVNPAFAGLPSVSSILDTSNYTFQAVTFGKDADGFTKHAHGVSSVEYVDGDPASGASAYDQGILTVINLGSDYQTSSYIISSVYVQYSSTYNSVPNYPSITDTRLERASTSSTNLSSFQYASSLPDLGHYANAAVDPLLSSIWNKVGGFVPSGTLVAYKYNFYDKNESYLFSSTIASYFNRELLMDKNGYLTISPSSVNENISPFDYANGSLLVSSSNFSPSTAGLIVQTALQAGDAASLAAFGGVKHIGVYCLDLKDMLVNGLTPPYTWDALNNNRKYKLVAKSTLLEDPLWHIDLPASNISGFQNGLNSNIVTLKLTFDFK